MGTLKIHQVHLTQWLFSTQVIEIDSDDDAPVNVRPDAATQARLDAAEAQRSARVKRQSAGDDDDRDRRVASFVRAARSLSAAQLRSRCEGLGLKVGGTKHERIARLAYFTVYQIRERPRSDAVTKAMVAQFAARMDAIVERFPGSGY